jgi:hypothetical protein
LTQFGLIAINRQTKTDIRLFEAGLDGSIALFAAGACRPAAVAVSSGSCVPTDIKRFYCHQADSEKRHAGISLRIQTWRRVQDNRISVFD